MLNKNICLIAIFLSLQTLALSQKQDYKVSCIAFYNLENLFDTVNDTLINDEEFLPEGSKAWDEEKFEEKIGNMAYVIDQIGNDHTDGPSVLGVCEIENRYVLEQLVAHPTLAPKEYDIIHFDSPDERGIDVGMIYRTKHFTPISSQAIPLIIYDNDGERNFTRDILHVYGLLDGDPMHFMVNHWPSRSGGEKKSSKYRNAAAKLCREVVDSLTQIDPLAKVIIMGDLNDDPTSESVRSYLRAKKSIKGLEAGGIYNPMADFYRRGVGSNAYRDAWSLFDQMLLTEAACDKDQEGYFYYKANVFNKQFLANQNGHFKGYPFRTFAGGTYIGGYSDHYPVYVHLVKKI